MNASIKLDRRCMQRNCYNHRCPLIISAAIHLYYILKALWKHEGAQVDLILYASPSDSHFIDVFDQSAMSNWARQLQVPITDLSDAVISVGDDPVLVAEHLGVSYQSLTEKSPSGMPNTN